MEPTLAVIGLNFRTSPVAIRERFWIAESRRHEALHQLVRSEGIEEVIVLATCNRTEFIVWANDVPEAANSVLRFLTHEYQLKLCEWSHFYRLMDDVALTHVFQVAAGLDSMVLGEPEIAAHLREALHQAQKAGTSGRFLDGILQKAQAVSARVRSETTLADSNLTVPYASVELSIGVLGDLSGCEVLLVGAGKASELAAKCLRRAGATRLKLMSRTTEKAEELAFKLNATAVSCADRLSHLKSADIVVCSTSCPHAIISLEDAHEIIRARYHKPMVMIDISVPRDIDPRVGEVDGIHLFDMDDLERVVKKDIHERRAEADEANKIVADEVLGFRRKLMAERVIPTVVALRQRLEELCQQEVEFLRREFGPFTDDQDQILTTLAAHITQRLAGSLARELRELPDRTGQDMLTIAVHRLFQLEQSNMVEVGKKTDSKASHLKEFAMPVSAQDNKTNTTLGFTSVQAYTLAVITLVIGTAVGYFARGSAPTAVAPEASQTAAPAPAGMGGGAGMAAGQLPGIGSQQQGGTSPEMLSQAAQPLVTKLQANPKDFETLRQLGNLYYDGQAFPQAIEYYTKALAIDPKNPDVLTDLGTAYWYSGDPDKALVEFGKSLAVRPNHPGTMFNEGIVMWQGKKDPKGAVVVWEQLLKTNPNYEQKDQVQMLIERAKMHGAGATKG